MAANRFDQGIVPWQSAVTRLDLLTNDELLFGLNPMFFETNFSLFAITDFWMARWLTPIWFLGVGISFGLIALAALIGLFYLLAKVPAMEKLRQSGMAHIVGLVTTLVLGGVMALALLYGPFRSFFYNRDNVFLEQEFTLICVANTMLIGVFVWSILFCSSERFMGEVKSLLFQGVGLYLLSVTASMAAIGLASSVLVDNPMAAIRSVPYLFSSGYSEQTFTVDGVKADADEAPFQKIGVRYDSTTLGAVEITSDRNILLADAPSISEFKYPASSIGPDNPAQWIRGANRGISPLPLVAAAEIYVQNQEIDPAKIRFRLTSIPPVIESLTFILTGIAVVGIGLVFLVVQGVAPKISAIALSAAKSELSQPLPVVLILIVALAILLFVFLPFHTFGEDIKLLKDCGVTLILIAATFQAVWSASTSVNEEIEGKTALTLLSKPIHRRSFIIGKIFGVFWIVLFMFLLLGSAELLAVAYKPIVDARESSLEQPPWQQCHVEMMQTIPGLTLAFLQAIVLGAFAVALGTRLPLLANFTVCFSIYLLGHLTPTIVESATGGLPLVEFVSQLIAAVVPNLNHFSMEAAIDAEVGIPWSVIAGVLVYTTIYCISATLLGLLLFEDRDLA